MLQRLSAPRTRVSRFAVLLLPVLMLFLAACSKPEITHTTSPSARALLGSTEGNVSFDPTGEPPTPVGDPDGWRFDLANVRFAKLEDGSPSLQVVTDIIAKPGPGLEFWITGPNGPVYRWSGGSARQYDGVMCFQLRLEGEDGSTLPLGPGPHDFTAAFRDPGTGEVVTAKKIQIAGFQPDKEGPIPGPESDVGKVLLGCPRSVI